MTMMPANFLYYMYIPLRGYNVQMSQV